MDLKIEQVGRINLVRVIGEVDETSALQIQERILPLVKSGNPLLLELSGVTSLSSAGLRSLLRLKRQLSGRGGLAVVGLSQQIKETMSVTGLGEFFHIYASLEEGAAALGGS